MEFNKNANSLISGRLSIVKNGSLDVLFYWTIFLLKKGRNNLTNKYGLEVLFDLWILMLIKTLVKLFHELFSSIFINFKERGGESNPGRGRGDITRIYPLPVGTCSRRTAGGWSRGTLSGSPSPRRSWRAAVEPQLSGAINF